MPWVLGVTCGVRRCLQLGRLGGSVGPWCILKHRAIHLEMKDETLRLEAIASRKDQTSKKWTVSIQQVKPLRWHRWQRSWLQSRFRSDFTKVVKLALDRKCGEGDK